MQFLVRGDDQLSVVGFGHRAALALATSTRPRRAAEKAAQVSQKIGSAIYAK